MKLPFPALPPSSRSRTALASLREVACGLALSALCGACDGSVIVHVPIVEPPPPPPVFSEGEPNDAAWLAPWFGSMYPGESIYVAGFSTDDGSDPQDGLAFTGFGPCRIDFTLYVDDPWADLDVWVYDPYFGEFVAAFTLPYGDESGTFWLDVPSAFHLVVVPAYGASSWTMAVSAAGSVYASALADTDASKIPDKLAPAPVSGLAGAFESTPIPALPPSLHEYRAGTSATGTAAR